jgi:hypothetical protein
MSYFVGMRGTGDWVTDERPKSWREGILRLYPQGKALITAIMSKMSSEVVTDPEFYWWTQTVEAVSGAITNIYTNAAMTTAYTTGGSQGDLLYCKVALAEANKVRPGHQIVLRYTDDSRVDVTGKVTNVVRNGANSRLDVKLLEDDDNSPDYDLSDANHFIVIGSINPEGGQIPEAITRNPAKIYNLTQIFRTPLEITRTALRTKLRTKEAYNEAKKEALEMHSIEMEMNTLFGQRLDAIGDNGKPERTTMGIIPFVRANAPANVDDFKFSTNINAGDTWLEGGKIWLDTMFEQLARYANMSDMVWCCGSTALLAINRLAAANSEIQLVPTSPAYGLQVVKWITPFGDANLMTHPLLSQGVTTRKMMVGITPKSMKFKYIDDTFFKNDPEKEAGEGSYDATKEEFLTEGGYEYQHPEHFMILDGLGDTNLVT